MKAWELLSDKRKWTQGALARSQSGEVCLVHSDVAESFCARGAIYRLYGDCISPTNEACRVALQRHQMGITFVNDMLGYDAVLSVLKEADV